MADTNQRALVLPANPAASTNSAGTADIRDIKGPVEIPSTYGWIAWVAGAVLAALALYLLAKRFLKRRSMPKLAAIIPPHRKAKDRLRAANELLSDPYKFCSLVSDVVRVYLEERFDLRAPERTTEEFLEEMRVSPRLSPAHKLMLEDFLTQCDLVKFARMEPSQDQLKRLLDSALRLIDETAPAPAPAGTQEVRPA